MGQQRLIGYFVTQIGRWFQDGRAGRNSKLSRENGSYALELTDSGVSTVTGDRFSSL
jgi:hypothetical protein